MLVCSASNFARTVIIPSLSFGDLKKHLTHRITAGVGDGPQGKGSASARGILPQIQRDDRTHLRVPCSDIS